MKAALAAAIILGFTAPALAGPAEDLMAVDRAFARMARQTGYNEAYLAYLAVDGQTFTGDHPIRGKADAIRSSADPKNASPDPHKNIRTWEPDAGGVSADGTLGWTEGHWLHKGPAGNGTGHYMTIWVKEHGAWKVRADLGSDRN
jgi:Domain of unknown function (DUF4440)